MTSLRDTLLIAGFEIKRAIRTWRALALFLLYLIANTGAAYLFVQLIGAMEVSLANTLGVAAPDTPGALLESLTQRDMFRHLLEGMVVLRWSTRCSRFRSWPSSTCGSVCC